jgi:hypothetical protein
VPLEGLQVDHVMICIDNRQCALYVPTAVRRLRIDISLILLPGPENGWVLEREYYMHHRIPAPDKK